MRILVTGGAGFIGSHLVDELIARKYSVCVIDDLSSGDKKNVNKKAKFIRMDIRDKNLAGIVMAFKPNTVFHFAAQIDPRLSVVDPSFDADVNIVGSLKLLEASRRAKAEKFIFSSSGGAIYGGAKKIPTTENYIPHPFSPYGASKHSFEEYLHCYFHIYGFSYAALRYANVYGPRQSGKGEAGVVAVFTKKMLHGEQPIINGNGRQTRDFVFVSDIVRANVLAMSPKAKGIYNIGAGVEISINQIFFKLRDLINPSFKAQYGQGKKGEERRSCLDAKKAKKELGWKPSVGLDKGLEKTVDWFRPRVI